MTRAFVSAMAARGSGNVCNVNGPGAWFPWPGSVAYAAARWALRGFSAALRVDLRGTGVTVTDVVMSKVASTYWDNNPGAAQRVPWVDRIVPTMSVEQAAAVITRAVERERREATGPFAYTVIHQIGRLFPRLVHWCVYIGGAKRPPGL